MVRYNRAWKQGLCQRGNNPTKGQTTSCALNAATNPAHGGGTSSDS